MAASDPEWWTRGISIVALLVSIATFIWTRLDKRRERKAAEQAALPTVSMRWNREVDKEGWYRLGFFVRNIEQEFQFERARLIKPRKGAVLANWNEGKAREPIAKDIELNRNWEFHPVPNPPNGAAPGRTHLLLRVDKPTTEIKVELDGRFRSGTRKSFKIVVVAQPE